MDKVENETILIDQDMVLTVVKLKAGHMVMQLNKYSFINAKSFPKRIWQEAVNDLTIHT